MKQLTAKDFKNKGRKKVKVKELDGYVFIKKLSVGEAFSFRKDDISDDDRSHKMIMQSVVDDDGRPVFTDVEQVQNCGLAEFTELTKAILDYNGLSEEIQEETRKN